MGTIADTWSGDWQQKVRARVNARGFETIAAFLASMPGATYAEAAAALGDDVAPIQVTRLHLGEARKVDASAFRAAAIDSLVRYLRQRLPDGWGRQSSEDPDLEPDFLCNKAFTGWEASLEEADAITAGARCQAVWQRLCELAPLGWLPADANDDVIRRVFDAAWPAQ